MRFTRPLQLASLLVAAALGGCMLTPWDGYVLADEDEPIHFRGYHVEADQELLIEAWNPATEAFETLEATYSSSSDEDVGAGRSFYPWEHDDVVIPSEFWEPGCYGSFATVRTYAPELGVNLVGAVQDFEECWAGVDYDEERFSECITRGRPGTRIVTEEFVAPPNLAGYSHGNLRHDGYCGEIVLDVEVVGQYDREQVRLTIGESHYLLDCERESSPVGRAQLRCRLPLGENPGDIAESWEELRELINDGDLSWAPWEIWVRGLVADRCDSPTWTPWIGGADVYIPSESSSEHCEVEVYPNEPDEPNGSWWDITCSCVDATAQVPVSVNLCMTTSVVSPVTGASASCGYTALDLERLSGLDTTCVLDEFMRTGEGPCMPGQRSITGIGF